MTSMNFDITAQDSASREFLAVAQAAEKLEDKLRKLDKMTAEPSVDLNIDPANRKLDQLKTRLDALKNVRTNVELDGADKARKDVSDLVVELRKLRDSKVNLDLASGTARNDIRQISDALKSLRDAKVGITVSIAGEDKLDRLIAKIAKLSDVKVKVTVDVDDGQLTGLSTRLKALPNKRTVKVDVDTDSGGGMSRLAKIATAIAALSPLAVASFGSSTAAVASFGGALATAVPIAVAGVGMLGGVLATLQVGTQGVGLAMGALAEGDMKKFKQALDALSPNARDFTLVLKDLYLQLKQSTGGVQDKLFDGLSASFKRMGEAEVPLLIRGMGGVATELNKAAKEAMTYLGSAEGIARQTSMWVSTRQVVANLAPAFTDVIAILSDLGEVGGKVLADVTDGVGGVTQKWRDWIAEARNSGRLEEIMRGGVEVFGKLGSIIGNTGSILASFYRAATAAGSDFLTTLDRGTEAAARFLKSAEGQNSLVTFFRESRAAIDALMPGLSALGRGIMEAVRAFGETQGLSTFGAAVGQILTQVGAVLGPLGTLAGNTLKTLAQSAAIASQALGPIVQGLLNLINATGPVGPAIVAMVIAFKSLSGVSATVTALGAAVGATATKWGMYATAVTGSMTAGSVANSATEKLGGAISKLGAALPVIGVAVVALGVAYETFGSKADQVAQRVINGSMTLTQAIAAEQAQVEKNQIWWNSAAQKQDAYAAAAARVTDEFKKQYDALSPMAKLQADVAIAQAKLNDLMAAGKGGTAEAAAASSELAAAQGRLKTAQDGAAAATKSHSEAMRDQVLAAEQLLGGMLAVEDSLARVAEAEKAANEEVAKSGAESDKAKAALNDHAQAALSAAESIGKLAGQQAEARAAGTGAAAESRAYGAALLTMAANASGPAQTALKGHLAQLSQSKLDALSAGSAATGFGTKIMQLPGGKTVKIAVDPETGKIVSTQQLLDAMSKNPVTIKIGADTVPADQAFQRVLSAVQQGKATVMIDGQNLPALDALREVGRLAGLENATVNIGGNPVNGMAALDGFIAAVKTGNPIVNIGGQDYDARVVFAALKDTVVGEKLLAALDLDPSAAYDTLAGFKGQASAPISPELGLWTDPAVQKMKTVRADGSVPVTMPLGADPSGANAANAGVRDAVQQPATKPMGGDPAGAMGANGSVNTAVQAPATKPIQGNPADANAKNAGVNGAVQTPATKPMNGNPADANAKNSALNRDIGITATKPISANTNPAQIIWDAFKRSVTQNPIATTITTTIKRIFETIGIPFAGGGILPMAAGGVVADAGSVTRAYAAGGADRAGKTYNGHRLTPMSGNRATEVAPRTYRVIGDRQKDTEVFIPLNGSKRSLAYTKYAANEQGYALTPLGAGPDDGSDTEAYGRGGHRRRHHRRRHHRHHRRHGHGPSNGPVTPPPATGPAPTTPPATTPPAGGPAPATPPAAAAGTTYTTSQVSTTAPFVQPVGSIAQPPVSTTPGNSGGGGIDLSGLIAEVQAVKAAVLATGPNNTDVVGAVVHLENAVTGDRRGGHGYRAQCRRSDGELSRI